MKARLFISFLLSISFVITTLSQENPDITVGELEEHVGFLASDGFGGRLPGTDGDMLSQAYIAGRFQRAKIELLANDGFQYFELVTSVEAGENNSINFPGLYSVLGEDFTPLSFSKNSTLKAGVVFAGYGFQVENDTLTWDDYEGIDVKGKWVVILRGEPGEEVGNSPFASFVGLREKVLAAKDLEAGGVLFVSGPSFDEEDAIMRMFYDKTTADAGMPVFHVKRYIADSLLGISIASLEKKIQQQNQSNSFESTAILEASSEVIHQKVKTANIVGRIEGSDPAFSDEIIVIGAHYDHLGMGGPGSGSREPDTEAVHNGADDNASGVAGIIEIAEKIAAEEEGWRRTIVVVAFGAEEMGLIGSKYFVENPVIEMENVIAMFNFDMIGRLSDEASVAIGGTGTSLESEDLLTEYLDHWDLKGSYSKEGFGPSDHAAFYAEDIPVFFISTGAHQDYHTPQDDVEFINFEGEKIVADFAFDLIKDVANRDEKLTYQEAGAKTRSGGRMKFKVTLGIVPDFTSTENNGLGVGGTRSGGPAEKAGMLKGDLIVAMDGLEVTNIYDYMARLKKLEPGQIITVDVMRDGEKVVLLVQL